MDKEVDKHIEECLKLLEVHPWATTYNCLATYVIRKRMPHSIIVKMFYKIYNPSDYPLEKDVDMIEQLFTLNWVTEKEFDGRRYKHQRG